MPEEQDKKQEVKDESTKPEQGLEELTEEELSGLSGGVGIRFGHHPIIRDPSIRPYDG